MVPEQFGGIGAAVTLTRLDPPGHLFYWAPMSAEVRYPLARWRSTLAKQKSTAQIGHQCRDSFELVSTAALRNTFPVPYPPALSALGSAPSVSNITILPALKFVRSRVRIATTAKKYHFKKLFR